LYCVLEHRWIAGQPHRPVLVLLHEGLGSVSMWRDFPDALVDRTGCSALVYSRAGHGTSPPPDVPRNVRFMHDEANIVLPALLAQFGIEQPILIGHSDGGSIALIFAGAAFTSQVDAPSPRGLILLAPHVFVEDCSIASIARMRDLYATTDLGTRLGKYHTNVDAAFHGWNDVWLDPAFRSWNIEEYLPAITCPVLVLQGEDDEYGTWAQVDAIASQVRGPVETALLPRCGHSPHRDRRDEVLARIAGFIDRY
jgi:pimeloyl-ACP methyl ester carboxylesterase